MHNVAVDNRFPTISESGYWFRLIPSRFPTIDLYKRVAPPEHWPLAQAIEGMTNPRVRAKERLTKDSLAPTESSPKLQNWNHAPFSYRNPDGSRFLGPDYGVLELSDSVQTALAVSIRKREMFLSATDTPPLDIEMRVLKHQIAGQFYDVRTLPIEMPEADRWSLGRSLLEDGASGVKFMCPYRSGGYELAIFDNDVLGPAIQTQHYKFRWDGKQIAEIYNFRDEADGRAIAAAKIFLSNELQL